MFVVLILGTALLSAITGIPVLDMGDSSKLGSHPKMVFALRGMMLLQFLGLFAIPSLLFAYFSDPHPASYLGLKKPARLGYWPAAIALLFVALPLVEYTGIINRGLKVGGGVQEWARSMEEEASKTVQFLLGSRSISDLLINLLFVAGFAAVGEELFFRGILQRLFIRSTRSPWVGIIIAAFLFSFLHFQFFGFIPRFILGIVLGAIYWYSGSLWTAIAAHFVYDAFIIVMVYLNPAMLKDPEAPLMHPSYLGITALLSLGVTAAIIAWMKKASTTRFDEVYGDEDRPTEKDFTF
jgi:membrane protease YdiL (CAAX protease family)